MSLNSVLRLSCCQKLDERREELLKKFQNVDSLVWVAFSCYRTITARSRWVAVSNVWMWICESFCPEFCLSGNTQAALLYLWRLTATQPWAHPIWHDNQIHFMFLVEEHVTSETKPTPLLVDVFFFSTQRFSATLQTKQQHNTKRSKQKQLLNRSPERIYKNLFW